MSEYRTDRCGWKQTRACYGSNGGQQSLAALRPQGMSCGCHQLQWRQATWLVLYRFRACRSLSSVMPTFLLLSVLAFVLLPHLGVLGTFPSPLPFLFVVRKEAYVAYIFQYPECWYSDLPSCHFFFLALPCILSLLLPCVLLRFSFFCFVRLFPYNLPGFLACAGFVVRIQFVHGQISLQYVRCTLRPGVYNMVCGHFDM